jgi:8-oxo-dGTP diphosphatase
VSGRWPDGSRSGDAASAQPGRTTVGVVLVGSSGEVLLQLRDDRPDISDPNLWVIPGGGVDPGETLEQAARREIVEETEYEIGDMVYIGSREMDRGGGSVEQQHFFVSRYDGQQAIHCHEGQELRFVHPAVLPTLATITGLEQVIASALGKLR